MKFDGSRIIHPSTVALPFSADEKRQERGRREHARELLLVKRLGVSRRLLELRYREAEGTTLCKALAARRLEAARKQILTTRRTIMRIAAECGFSDAKHLTHRFVAAYGLSPKEVRRQNSVR